MERGRPPSTHARARCPISAAATRRSPLSNHSIRSHRGRRAIAGAMALLLGLATAGLALAAPAGAAGTVKVTPHENLTDGQTVTVAGDGLPAGQLALTQCGNATTDGTPLPEIGRASWRERVCQYV